MIRTIIWFIWFFLSLIISIPFLLRVKYLAKKGRVEERSKGKYTWIRKPS